MATDVRRFSSFALTMLLAVTLTPPVSADDLFLSPDESGGRFLSVFNDDDVFVAAFAPADTDDDEAEDQSDAASELSSLRKRIDELEKAEKKRMASEKKKAEDEKKKKEADAQKANDWIDLSSEKWTVKLGGHVQMDYVNWANTDTSIANGAKDAKDFFEFRRLRLVADGTGYGVYDFRLQMTLEPETTAALSDPESTNPPLTPAVKDAYFSINEVPWFGRIRIGNFFVPFSLEQVTNDTNNIFMERSIPTQGVFAADREVGVAVYNASSDQSFTWTYGAFFDSISEGFKQRINNTQGYRLSGRVTWLPYYDELSNGRYLVHTGAGVLFTDDLDNKVQFASRPQVHLGPRIIDSGIINADNYTTGNLELAVVWGRIALQSEVFVSETSTTVKTGDPETFTGGYAHVSYFLTGENRIFERFGQHGAQFGRNAPFTNVFATAGGSGLGAWELKARYSNLDLSAVNKGVYNDVTAGVNWYWSDRVRIMFDWIHPVTSQNTVFHSTQSDLLASRFDFNW